MHKESEAMRSIEIESDSIDKAIALALKELKVSISDVTIEVLQEPVRGLLGIVGGKPAKVRVTLKDTKNPSARAAKLLEELLALMGITTKVDVQEVSSKIKLNIRRNPFGGLLIGTGGKTLDAIQNLLNLMMKKEDPNAPLIEIDYQKYRERRQAYLTQLIEEAKQKVKATQAPVELKPMSASDRRFIHLSLRKDPSFKTESIGKGNERRVVISPVKSEKDKK